MEWSVGPLVHVVFPELTAQESPRQDHVNDFAFRVLGNVAF